MCVGENEAVKLKEKNFIMGVWKRDQVFWFWQAGFREINEGKPFISSSKDRICFGPIGPGDESTLP